MRKNYGTKWTQLPLTFCGGPSPEQKPTSHAPPNNEHTGPLADFVCDIDAKTTEHQLKVWKFKHLKRIRDNLSPSEIVELEKIYQARLEELKGVLVLRR